jgi:hypothetical protein
MATGPEHYREAERLLMDCQVVPADERNPATYPAREDGVNSIANALAAAQVHATLAKAPAASVDLSELRRLVRAFDPTGGADRARAFKKDLLQVIVDIERGGA